LIFGKSQEATQMNRLFVLTALPLFLGLDASHAQTSLHQQRVDEQIDETSCASANWLSRAAQLAESTQSDVRGAVSSAIEVCGDSARLSGNYVIAMKWWRRAADRGNAAAQMKLAGLYEGRGGIPTDYTQAYKWYDIAAAIIGAKIDALPIAASHNGEKNNSDQLWYRDQVAKHMTAAQIAEAQRLAREWKPEQ
jgi:TPR repeat protein